ncbi:hypothetical protein J5N97_010005 [Dioscorea zingiberensis]|uniref:Myosin N-terminal SH3-like domain-containing protein n=1 Tax=Dioscorea zingiberensis TaxID=325984 RepID=A0A9D5HM35_9LILI|nr:hypothetical protein J5N97_010005 [Dioscorea zingiberensis]
MSYRKGSTVWVEDKDAAWVEAEVVDVKDAVVSVVMTSRKKESFERIRGHYTRESDIESGNRISPNSRDMEMNGFFEKVGKIEKRIENITALYYKLQVKFVNGSKILRIHKTHELAPEVPEYLYHLIKKAVAIKKHLQRNKKDKDSMLRTLTSGAAGRRHGYTSAGRSCRAGTRTGQRCAGGPHAAAGDMGAKGCGGVGSAACTAQLLARSAAAGAVGRSRGGHVQG